MKTPAFRSRAFSLIEVTLALGIASFAFIAILGLLPMGLNASQRAVNSTYASLFSEEIARDVRTTAARKGMGGKSDFFQVDLVPNGTTPIFLDRSGQPLASGNAPGAAMAALVKVYGQSVANLSATDSLEFSPGYHASVKIWWPAAAQEKNAMGMIEVPFTIRPNS